MLLLWSMSYWLRLTTPIIPSFNLTTTKHVRQAVECAIHPCHICPLLPSLLIIILSSFSLVRWTPKTTKCVSLITREHTKQNNKHALKKHFHAKTLWVLKCLHNKQDEESFTPNIIQSVLNKRFPTRTSWALVPLSIRSSLVQTPMVRLPSESTSLAICSESEFAMSTFAGETAK